MQRKMLSDESSAYLHHSKTQILKVRDNRQFSMATNTNNPAKTSLDFVEVKTAPTECKEKYFQMMSPS